MFDKNSFWFGLLFGIVFPALIFIFLYGIDKVTGAFSHPPAFLSIEKMLFVSAALNILPIRYYFVHEDLRETAKGLLFITLVLVLVITFVSR
jgi:hypothetical protein